MKARILLLLITLSSIASFGQKLTLEKASPFTAVKWVQDDPIVQFNEQWYSFEKLDHLNKKEILDFCKNEYGHKWKKRFSEDLVEVLNGLQYIPNVEVDLVLSKEGKSKTYKGKFTLSNRDSCLLYNKSNKKKKRIVKNISKAQAIQDLKQLKEVLDSTSSYAQIGNYNYSESLKKLAYAIKNGHTDVSVNWLANEMAKIMSEIGDRHSSIKNKSISKQTIKAMDLRLPFGVTVLDNQLIAVKKTSEKRGYNYYLAKYPYIKSINGIAIETLLETYNYSDKKAPKEARLKRGAYWLERFGHLLYKNNKSASKKMEVVFTDGKLEKKLTVDLTKEKLGYRSNLENEVDAAKKDILENHNFNRLKRKINNTIGYIKIPKMFHPQEVEGLEHFIKNTLNKFSDTKSLIIDLRYNPGGGREILKIFANYIVQPNQSPWVANVAYLRSNEPINTDENSMSGRFLYNYNSEHLSNLDRKAIDTFSKNFKIEKEFDRSKFSSPFYMLLHAGKKTYSKPIYILVNENSFSAATVFTTAFKGLPNVKIVGVTTDGSSGNSINIYLNNSNIRVKVSTMLSFQRNGKTLDGNGTEPDIYIPIDLEQVFTGKDTQLQKLVEIINKQS